MITKVFTREEWEAVENSAHAEVFNNEHGFNKLSAYKATITAINAEGEMVGYMQVADCMTGLYLEYGGACKQFKNTIHVLSALKAMIDKCLEQKPPYITTHVRNTNLPMLKLYFKLGFIVTGINVLEDQTLLELTLKGDK